MLGFGTLTIRGTVSESIEKVAEPLAIREALYLIANKRRRR
jgi:hypothetical protein